MGDLYASGTTNQSAPSTTLAVAQHRNQLTLFTSAPCVTTLTTQWCNALETDYNRLTPYRVEGWVTALHQCNLQQKYPNLVHDLMYGSRIGIPPLLSHTFIPPNMTSANEHAEMVDQHFQDELNAGRMSGPYTVPEAMHLFHGHFRMAPIGLIEKPPGCGKWRMC